MFQFTLPHGERLNASVVALKSPVSIHAPAWGATARSRRATHARSVSIHAPAWGATATTPRSLLLGRSFNSRSRMGSDRGSHLGHKIIRSFNSRSRMGSDYGDGNLLRVLAAFQFTLPHGERPTILQCATLPSAFQFTLPHGERLSINTFTSASLAFQFTLPHGERQVGRILVGQRTSFNSRSRMGSDLSEIPDMMGQMVSIHAPAWGATSEQPAPPPAAQFQFTLPHGERQSRRPRSRRPSSCFNSRSRMGSDLTRASSFLSIWKFQFTLPHGERP